MGDKTQIERIIDLEAAVKVLVEEVAILRADMKTQQRELLGGKKNKT